MHTVSFATDAGWFQRMGMECVIWGTESIEDAHRPDERLSKEEFFRASKLLDAIIGHYYVRH